jgi:hypothetical protein
MNSGDKPAYPVSSATTGVTKRELFAKDIACHLIQSWDKAHGQYIPASETHGIKDLCAHAIEITDELLKQLES